MAAERRTISLLNLPTELLHRICDFLDAETIVLSFRSVCVQLFAVTKTYNRYKLRFTSTSKIHICRLIPAKNVVLLDFGNKKSAINDSELFLSIFDIYQFTRLRSLLIPNLNISNARIILDYVAIHRKLTSFSIYTDISCNPYETLQFLTAIIEQSSLRHLLLNFDLSDKEKFVWPMQYTLTNLSIGSCTIKQFCSILDSSPHLHTLIIKNCQMNETLLFKSYPQLTSLTLNDVQMMTMDKLELFLSFLPSLTHIDLISSGKPFAFLQRLSQWEEFIRTRLPRLQKFEFCIFCYSSDWENFDTLIAAFRTPFWLEEKHWFVKWEFRGDWTSSFTLFTSSELS